MAAQKRSQIEQLFEALVGLRLAAEAADTIERRNA
jgi:hypothetical protein